MFRAGHPLLAIATGESAAAFCTLDFAIPLILAPGNGQSGEISMSVSRPGQRAKRRNRHTDLARIGLPGNSPHLDRRFSTISGLVNIYIGETRIRLPVRSPARARQRIRFPLPLSMSTVPAAGIFSSLSRQRCTFDSLILLISYPSENSI